MKMYSSKLLKSNKVLPKFAQILETEIEHGHKLNGPKLETGEDIGRKFKF